MQLKPRIHPWMDRPETLRNPRPGPRQHVENPQINSSLPTRAPPTTKSPCPSGVESYSPFASSGAPCLNNKATVSACPPITAQCSPSPSRRLSGQRRQQVGNSTTASRPKAPGLAKSLCNLFGLCQSNQVPNQVHAAQTGSLHKTDLSTPASQKCCSLPAPIVQAAFNNTRRHLRSPPPTADQADLPAPRPFQDERWSLPIRGVVHSAPYMGAVASTSASGIEQNCGDLNYVCRSLLALILDPIRRQRSAVESLDESVKIVREPSQHLP